MPTLDQQQQHDHSRERQLFDAVASLVQSSPAASSAVSDTLRLRFYGLYKRVTVGPLHHGTTESLNLHTRPPQPSRWNLVAWYKYEAWAKCDHLTDTEAMMEYVRLAAQQDNETATQCRTLLSQYEQERNKDTTTSDTAHSPDVLYVEPTTSSSHAPNRSYTRTSRRPYSIGQPFLPRGQLDIQWNDLAYAFFQCIFFLIWSILGRWVLLLPSPSSISLWKRQEESVAKAWIQTSPLQTTTTMEHPNYKDTDPLVVTALSVRSLLDLYLSVRQYPPGSEIIVTPPINIEGMIRVMQYHNLHIVPVDVQLDPEEDLSLDNDPIQRGNVRFKVDLQDIAKHMTVRTVAIMIVHPFGNVCLEESDMKKLKAMVDQYSTTTLHPSSPTIDILEDCAECYSAHWYRGSPWANVLFFSLGTIKTSTALGGGMALIRHDPQLGAKMKEWQCRMYRQQTHVEYGIKVIQLTFLHWISKHPVLCGLMLRLIQIFGFDYDQMVTEMVRGFPSSNLSQHPHLHPYHHLMMQIRRRPCLALLGLIRRRLYQWKQTEETVQSRIHRCRDMNQRLLQSKARVRLPVSATNPDPNHLYWLYPILVSDPTHTEHEMRKRGFDVPKGASQMKCITDFLVGTQVDFDACPNAKWMMQHVLYLPIASRSISSTVMDELCIALEDSTKDRNVVDVKEPRLEDLDEEKQRNVSLLFLSAVVGCITMVVYPQTFITMAIFSLVGSFYVLWFIFCILILLRVLVGSSYIDESDAYSKYCCMASESMQDEPDSTVEGTEDRWTMGRFESHRQSDKILSLAPLCIKDRPRLVEENTSTKNRVLLTGATGFIGSLVLRNLLLHRKSLNIEGGIVLICRSRKNLTSIERIQKLLGDAMFSFLSTEEKNKLITVFDGDVSLPKLGLSEANYSMIIHELQISHIIHCAASVSFTLSLSEAASSNITPALQLQALRKEMKNEDTKFIYVSTAFVHGKETGTRDKPLREDLYDIDPFDPVLIYESMVTTQIYAAEAMTKLRFPNTYSLSKCVCEHLLSRNETNGNTIIIRPSIVGPSVQEPYEGWSGFFPSTLIASGCLYYMYQYLLWNFSDELVPVIPVDVVAKFIVAKAFGSPEDYSASPRSQTSSDNSDDSNGFEVLSNVKVNTNSDYCIVHSTSVVSSCRIHNVAWNSSSVRESQFSWYDFARAIVQNGSAKGLFIRPVAYLGYYMIFTVLPFMKPSHGLYRILHNIIVNISLFFFKGYCRAFGDSSRDLKKINRLKPFMDLPILFVHYTQSSFYFESELTAISDLNGERYMFSCVLAAEKFVLSYRNKPCDPNIHHAQPVIVPKKPQILTDLLWALTQPRGNLAIRFAAFSIRQILSMTETDLTIDVDSFARLSQAVEEVNVQSKESITIVLAPTHRSLFDFLILSYVFFSIPEIQVDLPFIAAAEEFSTLPILGWLAQCCGAFFIKRGLGSVDKNLDQQIVNLKRKHNKSKRPFFVEVFVEGKRSRDRVFLKPKTGILKCLHAQCASLIILPIAINYEYLPDQYSLLADATSHVDATFSLSKLFHWLSMVIRGKVRLGRIHISASCPLNVRGDSNNWNDVVEIIQLRQMQHCFVSDFHIKCGSVALDLEPTVVKQGLIAAGCRIWPLSTEEIAESVDMDIDLNEAWYGFLQSSHVLGHFVSPENVHWLKWLRGLSSIKVLHDPCFIKVSNRMNQILFDVDKAIGHTVLYLEQKGYKDPSVIHLLQYAKELQPTLPALLLSKALSIRRLSSNRTSNRNHSIITPVFDGQTASTSNVLRSLGRLKIVGDEEKFGAWGFRDTAFVICPDAADRPIVALTGERYNLSGRRFPSLIKFMEDEIGVKVNVRSASIPTAPEEPTVPASIITAEHLKMIKIIVNNDEDRVLIDPIARARHGTGHSQEDMFLIRNDLLHTMRLPDVIVYPKDEREIHQLLQLAATVKLAVIPFGGGTNVTHAIRCPSIEYESRPIVSIDLRLMNSILSVHDEDGIAHVQAGITGKALVAALAARGFTMGHEPDSYEFSTVGGWIATNASGMKQNKYGNIEQIVKDVRVVSSKGFIWQSAGPNSICSGRSSIGTNLVSLMIGSEGSLGIITSAKLKIWPLPQLQVFDSYLFPSHENGIRFVREISKLGAFKPASVRLLDNRQFRLGHAMMSPIDLVHNPFSTLKYIFRILFFSSCVTKSTVCCTLSFEGLPEDITIQRKMIKRLSRNNDGLPSGGAIGESGYNLTFTIAYLRDFAMTYGLLSESFETFAPWSKVDDVIRRTIDRVCREHAIRALPGKPFVSSRITQLYDEGACIYFYLCLYVDGVENPHVVFAEIEHAAREEILLCGATLSHHHGIGKLRSNFMDRINSVVFDDVLKEVKKSFDPDNVLIGNGSYYTN